MKKVLFFLESLNGGGAEKVLSDLVKNLDKTKFDITVATVVDVGVYKEEVKRECKYYSFLPNPDQCKGGISKFLYKVKYHLIYKLPVTWIYKMFVKGRYDIEVGFVEGFATKVIANSNNRQSKKLAWVHVDPLNWDYADNYYRNLDHQIASYKKYDKVVCVSKNVKQAFERKMYRDDNVVVKYNPVDSISIIAKSKERCIVKKPNKMLLGTIGRLVDEKGYDRLLSVIHQLKSEGLDFELWILGEGKNRLQLEQYIENHDLNETVKLIGFQNNPYKYIKLCDLFVCSSRAEGFSLAIAESIVLGLPIISTDCAGPNELLDNGKFGCVVKNDDYSLYEGLKQLMQNQTILMKYKKKSIERKGIFDIKITIKQIEELLG